MAKIYNYTQFVSESIKASEAYNTYLSLKTLVDGKRKVAFVNKKDFRYEDVKKLLTQLRIVDEVQSFKTRDDDKGFKEMTVKGEHGTVIIYHPDSYRQAVELKEIAERYGGLLHWQASLRDHRRIGELLGYEESDIDDFIREMRTKYEYENGLFKKAK